MIDTSDFKTGLTILYNGNIYQIMDFQHVKPGKGQAFVKTKLKNFFDVFLKVTPIIPPIVVPNVPKKSPINVVFSRLFIYNLPSKGIK